MIELVKLYGATSLRPLTVPYRSPHCTNSRGQEYISFSLPNTHSPHLSLSLFCLSLTLIFFLSFYPLLYSLSLSSFLKTYSPHHSVSFFLSSLSPTLFQTHTLLLSSTFSLSLGFVFSHTLLTPVFLNQGKGAF